ncbi:hypothetical protein C2S52_013108 [Perilla frutescens var. hirtella]|nr:hypothetical protein C2S52_013108 [Perilla frutescens var. hirtella]
MVRHKFGTAKVVRDDSDFEEDAQLHNQNEDTTNQAKEYRSKFKHNKRRESRDTILEFSDDDISVPRDIDGSGVPTHPKLSSRACPKLIFQANEKYTVAQREAVKVMGFQNILHMKVERVPTQLAYWVLDNFNANSSELTLANGRSIPVDEEDVHLVFGFPKGGRKIQRRRKSDVLDSEITFYNQFGEMKRDRIKLKMVYDKMMKDVDGGDVFKMNFVVLVTACLIESNINGYAAAPMLRYMDTEGLKSIHELDWCEYVIRSLIEHKRMWQANKTKSFGGPILFITTMYLDRVISHGKRLVDRSFPTVKGWTFHLIRKREKQEMAAGGFGGGRLCPQFEKAGEEEAPSSHDEGRRREGSSNDVGVDEMQQFATEFLAKSKLMADTMVQLILLIERALKHLWENPRFKKILDAGQQLAGCRLATHHTEESTRSTQFYDQEDDDDKFWSDPGCIAALEEIEKAILKREEWKNQMFDPPSFSLGLTQVFARADNITVEDQSIPNESRQEDYRGDADKENVEETEIISNKDNEGGADTKPTKGKRRKGKQPACEEDNVGRRLRSRKEKVISDAPVPPIAKRKGTTSNETELVDGSANLEQKDKQIYYWLVHHATENQEEVVFTYKNMNVRREEFQSLREGMWISTHVIDVWSNILNHNEAHRASTSPFRFFATTDASRYALGAPGWDDERVQSEFSDSLKLQLWRSEKHTLRNIDMFFFPVLSREHYYIVCFDMKKREALVIDNSDEREGLDIRQHYGSAPFRLQTVFADYLYTKGLKTKSLTVRRACMSRLEMCWRDSVNNNDCGVYVMRHMETYMGQSVNAWKCNLEKGNLFQLNVLRIKYCGSILASVLNEHAASVERSANATFAAVSKKTQSSVNDIMSGNV